MPIVATTATAGIIVGVVTLTGLGLKIAGILVSLATGERHGYGIIQEIEAGGDSAPDVGTMYRALARLAENGLIEPASRRASSDASEDRRNYYKITTIGRRIARLEAERLDALMRAARSSGLLPKPAK